MRNQDSGLKKQSTCNGILLNIGRTSLGALSCCDATNASLRIAIVDRIVPPVAVVVANTRKDVAIGARKFNAKFTIHFTLVSWSLCLFCDLKSSTDGNYSLVDASVVGDIGCIPRHDAEAERGQESGAQSGIVTGECATVGSLTFKNQSMQYYSYYSYYSQSYCCTLFNSKKN